MDVLCYEFCAASIQISPIFKLKPVDKVIAEIHAIRSLWPRAFIEFADDNTFVNRAHSKRLMRELAKQQVRWFTETDLSVADDSELLQLMRDSGCAQVLIGLESTVFSALDGLELRSNWKARQLQRYAEAVDRIQAHGIAVNGCFILGLDGAGQDSFDDIWRFARDSGLYEVQITVQTAFPGTPLYARLQRQGRILRERAWELCTLFDVTFPPGNMSIEELEAGLRTLAKRLYSENSYRIDEHVFVLGAGCSSIGNPHPPRKAPMNRTLTKILFVVAGVYDGLLGVAFLLFRAELFGILNVTPPNHPGYVQFPAMLLIVFSVMFFQIAADPARNRGLMWYGVGLKASYSGVVFWHQTHGGLPAFWIPWAWADLAFLVLFLVAWWKADVD